MLLPLLVLQKFVTHGDGIHRHFHYDLTKNNLFLVLASILGSIQKIWERRIIYLCYISGLV